MLDWLLGIHRDHPQSAFHVGGPVASDIASLTFWMVAVFGAVFLIVMLLLVFALVRKRVPHGLSESASVGMIVVGGLITPTVVLLGFMIYAFFIELELPTSRSTVEIEVTGHMWWWDVRYPEHDLTTANEIIIPVGEPIRLKIRSADVIHSFWVPNLHGKMDLKPDRTNIFTLRADKPGIYRGQCAEYCGTQHALMAFQVVAMERSRYDGWIRERARPHAEPIDPVLARGKQVFFEAACNNCHAIKGTAAVGRIGPDLTHIGSRLTLGAAAIPNSRAHLSGWISNPQAIKPGNKMPASYLKSEDLHALVLYMLSLE
jgi:cytochrome c oxidase subunit II